MDLAEQFAMLSPEEQRQFYQEPAMRPPSHIVSNFDNPPNQNALARGMLITAVVLSTISIIVRLYPRLFIGKRITLRLEDYLLIVAWAILGPWFYYAWGLIASAGIYVHQWNVRYADLVDFLFNLNAGFIVYGPLIALVKAVILLDWLHIFVPRRTRNATAWTIYIMIALNWAYYVAGSLACIFSCSPRKRFWDKTVPGTCTSTYATALTAGVVNMVSDFTMLAIPQRVIWSLQLTRSQRVGVSSLFAIGIFACVCAVARFAYSIEFFMDHDDVTYVVSPVGLWTIGEVTSAFLLVGVPSLPRVFKELRWMQCASAWLRSWMTLSPRGSFGDTRKDRNTFQKDAPKRRIRNDIYADLDDQELAVSHPARAGIIKETRVELQYEESG